jgi:predicted Zn-dependent protease with MMP-like domain
MRNPAQMRVERARRRRFERLVAEALDGLPEPVLAMLDNVDVVVEDEPTAEQLGGEESLFGLYQGVPLTQRDTAYSMVLPDKITVFRGPLERAYRNRLEMVRQVRITVLHELAHHVGFDEDRLDEIGLA